MGLDITAYEKVTYMDEAHQKAMGLYSYGDGPWILEEPEPRYDTYIYVDLAYTARPQIDNLQAGYYNVEGESYDFRAGSYSGYNAWRRCLATLVGVEDIQAYWENPTPGPFQELICFSDCEGIIGPETSAKLAQDFAAWRERAEAIYSDGSSFDDVYFMDKYRSWQEAFGLAANTGCVDFH